MEIADKWLAYSWEPSTKVPGGRKHRVEEIVEAATRIEAKQAFLEKHPEEMPYQVAASRIRTDEAKKDEEPAAWTHTGPGLKQTFPMKTQNHPLFDTFQEKLAVALDETQSTVVRDNAISWMMGASRVNVEDEFSVTLAETARELRALVGNADKYA